MEGDAPAAGDVGAAVPVAMSALLAGVLAVAVTREDSVDGTAADPAAALPE